MVRRTVLVTCVALLVCACCDRKSVVAGRLKDAWSQVSDSDHVRTRGIGVAPDTARGHTRRKAAARNAALVAARYEMLAIVKGIRVTGGLSVSDLMERDSHIKEVADRIIEGAEEVVTEWTEDDGCVVVLELRRDKVREILMRDESRNVTPLSDDVHRLWKAERVRDHNDQVAAADAAETRSKANRAVALGLLVPGLGQVSVAKYIRNPAEADAVRTRGWITMAMGLGWGAGAYVAFTSKPKTEKDPATGREHQQNSYPIGAAALGLAAFTQYWGLRDAHRTLENDRPAVALAPTDGGAEITFAHRF